MIYLIVPRGTDLQTEKGKGKREKCGALRADYIIFFIPRRSIRGGVGCAKALYSDVGIYRC